MSLLQNSNAISAGGYDINNSLRFRGSASAYLSRTMSASGTTATFSFWVKRGTLGVEQAIFLWSNGSTTSYGIEFNANDTLTFLSYSSAFVLNLTPTQVFRDPSAWYHIVCVQDTTQATAANRAKIYVNGTQVTAFSTATYPAQNTSLNIASSNAYNIGRSGGTGSLPFDGYMSEVNFIDGQALTPSSFGETDTDTGVWKPKAYTGTYGTNGFYLKFSDIATTSGSNAGLGKDFSGNGNYWNTNNISVTAGTTYDAMKDSPTLTSATVANYATLNPILQNGWWAAPNRGTISNGNLTHVSGGNTTAFGNFDFVANSGKWYYEVTCGATDSNNTLVIAAQSRSTFEVGYYQSGLKQINSATPTSYGSSWTSGDVIGVAIDVPNNTITFYKNNVSQGAISNTFPTGQPVYGGSYYNTSSGDYNYNFGQRPFSYTPPTGYKALNTFNLPDSTIKKGNKYMDATLYTGTGSTQSITNSGSFKPDLVWVKRRDGAGTWHMIADSVRGTGNTLSSNVTDAEYTGKTSITAFNTNGFTLGADSTGASYFGWNIVSNTYAGWQWQAGQGTTSSNTNGSITSTVSVNTTAGFSIVTYTGTGSAATIGHGLGVAPKMYVVKQRSASGNNWGVYHTGLTSALYAVFWSSTSAEDAASAYWNNTAPTSSVFSVGGSALGNASGATYVAYCWAEIAGFSKFGSYTGNGSADGPFVYTGFRPKFIMTKRASTAGSWHIYDSVRKTYNIDDVYLIPDNSLSEYSGDNGIDFLSNGFKLRSTNTGTNENGTTIIYAAFAENPFKNANAR